MEQTYKQCRHYGYPKCPHIKGDIMKRANQDVPAYYGKVQQMLPLPTDEEINNLCGGCTTFFKR